MRANGKRILPHSPEGWQHGALPRPDSHQAPLTRTCNSRQGSSVIILTMNEAADASPTPDADEELVTRFLEGDDRAFESLFLRYRHQIFSLAYRICGTSVEAEDMCQEIFLLAYRKAHTFKGDARFSTWLYRIGVNRCKDHLRKRGRSREMLTRDEESGRGIEELAAAASLKDNPDEPQSKLLAAETQDAIQEAIVDLPANLRLPLVMHDIQGMRYREIAGVLEIPVGTVKSRIFRGRAKLGEMLRPLEELWKD